MKTLQNAINDDDLLWIKIELIKISDNNYFNKIYNKQFTSSKIEELKKIQSSTILKNIYNIIETDKIDIFKIFIDNYKFYYKDYNYIIIDLEKKNNFEMFKYIIDNIKLLNLDDILILLIKNDANLQFFDYLIKNGANINCYNGNILSYSCLYLKLNIIKYFVKNGAVVSNNNYDALFNAIMRNNLELVNFLLEKDEIKTFNDGNNNCLSYAINWEYYDIALLLISHGFDIKQLDTKSEKIKTFLNELRKNKFKNIYEKTTDI